jgi:hypothetical protein
MDSDVVKKWLASEKIKWTKVDYQMTKKFYKLVDEYQNTHKSTWEYITDTETKRVLYKLEPNQSCYTFMTDSIINCNVKNLVACFEQVTILKDMYQTFDEVKWVKRLGDQTGLMYSR